MTNVGHTGAAATPAATGGAASAAAPTLRRGDVPQPASLKKPAPGTRTSDHAREGAATIDARQWLAPLPSRPGRMKEAPTLVERLEAMRAEQDPARKSRLAHEIATELEHDPPRREDFMVNGRFFDWEYRDAVAWHARSLEEAQQAAKPERIRLMREELSKTETGREMLEFERRAGVPIEVKTDLEWTRDGEAGVANSGSDGLAFNIRYLNAGVYVHEMTHQVDSKTGVIALAGDTRSKQEVIDQARAKYREYGLDDSEVEAVVEATYRRSDNGLALSHGHTRAAGVRLAREENGGSPLTDEEYRTAIELAVPREHDMAAAAHWHEHGDEARLHAYARTRGIQVAGKSGDQIAAELQRRADEAEAKLGEIERRGTLMGGKGGIGIGGIAGGVGTLAEAAAGHAGHDHGG